MNNIPYGPHVRIMCRPAAAPSCDLCVEYHDEDKGWVELARYNDMSDDYAHTNANNRAIAARRSILEGEAP